MRLAGLSGSITVLCSMCSGSCAACSRCTRDSLVYFIGSLLACAFGRAVWLPHSGPVRLAGPSCLLSVLSVSFLGLSCRECCLVSLSLSLFLCLFPCRLVVVVRPLSVILPVIGFLAHWWGFVAAAVPTERLRVDTLGVPMNLSGILVPNMTSGWSYSVPDL